MDFLTLVTEVGFPIAAALAAGLFVFITLRFILDGVLDDIKQQRIFVQALDNRIKTMNNEIIGKTVRSFISSPRNIVSSDLIFRSS